MHKEGQKISLQLTDAAKTYQDDIDGIKDQIQDLKDKLGSLENDRSKGIVALEHKLRAIGKKIHEIEAEDSSSPE